MKAMLWLAVTCVALAGFFHLFITPDAVYLANGVTHICWIWNPTNHIFVVFPI